MTRPDMPRVPLLAALLLLACGGSESGVLLVTLDTARADRLGCYGNPRIRTPHLDSIAR